MLEKLRSSEQSPPQKNTPLQRWTRKLSGLFSKAPIPIRDLTSPFLLDLLGRECTAPLPSIPAIIDQLAVKVPPDMVAITGAHWQPGYTALNQEANHLAARLVASSARPGGCVALLMSHDAPLMAAALGVLKAGGIVVVLNPSDPPPRWQQLVVDSQSQWLVTETSLLAVAKEAGLEGGRILTMPEPGSVSANSTPPEVSLQADDAAFLVYTSGTTGKPKGIVLTHGSIIHNAWRYAQGLGLRQDDRVLLSAPLSGGQGVGTVWTTLLNGATLCPYGILERGMVDLARWIRDTGVTVFVATASAFRHLMLSLRPEEQFPSVRIIRLASEHATSGDHALFQKHFTPQCRLVTAYSTSETGNLTLGAYAHDDEVPEGRLPAGKPSAGIEIHICDDQGNNVPSGHPGNLVVQSRHLSRGYWRNEELTQRRFESVPHAPGFRRYHTGDLARWNERGDLEILGRADSQVKIRGARVELGAVETALYEVEGVASAVVLAVEAAEGDTRLAAYLTLDAGQHLDGLTIRGALIRRLPSTMVPSSFHILREIPLNAHGKIDREALRRIPDLAAPSGQQAPDSFENATEEELHQIWAEVLHRDSIGRTENFFVLGGDSLAAAVIAARVHHAFGVAMNLQSFAEHPDLVSMSASITRSRERENATPEDVIVPILPAERGSLFPLAYNQERLWKIEQTKRRMNTGLRKFELLGPLDLEAFRGAVNDVISRHEILQTRIIETDRGPQQQLCPEHALEVPLVDVSMESDPDQAIADMIDRDFLKPFDFSTWPLFRLSLFRKSEDCHVLVRQRHHIISDYQSWQIFFSELLSLYQSRRAGGPSHLEEVPLQYGDYAHWERNHLRPGTPAFQDQIEWWARRFEGTTLGWGKVQPLPFSFRRPEPLTGVDPALGRYYKDLSPAGFTHLAALAHAEGTTSYVSRLAVFAAALAADCGQRDFVIGMYSTARHRPELQPLFGYFTNLLTLRFHFDPSSTFRQWLVTVRQLMADAMKHSWFPYEVLCEQLRSKGVEPPEIRVIFNNTGSPLMQSAGDLQVAALNEKNSHSPTMPWGMSVNIRSDGDESRVSFAFDANIYDPAGVVRMGQSIECLLDEVVASPDEPMKATRWWAAYGER